MAIVRSELGSSRIPYSESRRRGEGRLKAVKAAVLPQSGVRKLAVGRLYSKELLDPESGQNVTVEVLDKNADELRLARRITDGVVPRTEVETLKGPDIKDKHFVDKRTGASVVFEYKGEGGKKNKSTNKILELV